MRSLTLLSFLIFLPVRGLISSWGFGGVALSPLPPTVAGVFHIFILSCMLIGLSEGSGGLLFFSSPPSSDLPSSRDPCLPTNFPGTGPPSLPAFISEDAVVNLRSPSPAVSECSLEEGWGLADLLSEDVGIILSPPKR